MAGSGKAKSQCALLGGAKAVTLDNARVFDWPIVTPAHEKAVLEVLRAGKMSGWDITKEFEREYAAELGMTYALAHVNGTAAIHGAMFGLGVGVGDEVICPSITYWASIACVYSLGATCVFADIDPETLCVAPDDIEKRITPRTKVIVVVHYSGMPADMDRVMEIAKKNNLKVLEDCSHAHGGLYRGKEVGTFGDVSAFSLMSGKSFPIGEGGMMFTNDRRVYERAILFGHYARHRELELEDLKKYAGLPCGGYKYRLNQTASAFGRVQLTLHKTQMAEIDRAMNYFCDHIEGTPGLKTIRPAKDSGSTRAGWYNANCHYVPEELGGLSVGRFAEAVRAEGSVCSPGCNKPLHLHPLFSEMDVYGHGKPTRVANLPEGVTISQPPGSLPVSERINERICTIPWFKAHRPDIIEEHAGAFRKVAEHYEDLLEGDVETPEIGGYSSTFR